MAEGRRAVLCRDASAGGRVRLIEVPADSAGATLAARLRGHHGPAACAAWIAARYERAMSSRFATKAGRSRRFGPNPKPDFSGDFHPASREIKQERRST